ncbi:MAG: GNAT family N-acetyltransferase [Anaeromicrobium sp.]|uniref:GNAT family N-acetyltransferase n=1 Tax=Anaeromicrobium sp. TaxID=1929132 RepID=UPI0025D46177|nr:GNAT family N-acetyltransferase [Anaeromicrobium sp.]MCT4594548.1 GNAT family N-acetyltransferase [Anaeromicrobium sp.]
MDFKSKVVLNDEDYIIKIINSDYEDILQQLCERCSDYFQIERDDCPSINEGYEILNMLPPDKKYSDKFVFGVFNKKSYLVGVVDIVKDYPVKGEYMLGLMLIDPIERGRGLGKKLHHFLIEWSINLEADKLRIGVVEKNYKAYEFWKSRGYEEVKRTKLKHGNKENNVIVMNYLI